MSTIPVSKETKKLLESIKGDKAWDEFLNELASMALTEKRFKHRKRMQKLLEMGYDETRVRKWAREY
ncbi:MAG: hypothetical protein FGF51_07565 [Candidatus Brockarchaeota archaeon]|nr:hypothetical protein [Candidatus Brockarchaeota archaeon]